MLPRLAILQGVLWESVRRAGLETEGELILYHPDQIKARLVVEDARVFDAARREIAATAARYGQFAPAPLRRNVLEACLRDTRREIAFLEARARKHGQTSRDFDTTVRLHEQVRKLEAQLAETR